MEITYRIYIKGRTKQELYKQDHVQPLSPERTVILHNNLYFLFLDMLCLHKRDDWKSGERSTKVPSWIQTGDVAVMVVALILKPPGHSKPHFPKSNASVFLSTMSVHGKHCMTVVGKLLAKPFH